jgi:hypothetical protein
VLQPQTGTGITLAVPPAVDTISAVALDASPDDTVQVMLAVPYGSTNPANALSSAVVLGSALIPFDARLTRVDAPKRQDNWISGEGALAGGDGDTIAYLGTVNGELETQSATRLGSGSSTLHPIDTKGLKVTRPTIIRAATGYLVTWQQNSPTPPDELDAAFLDENLVARPPQTINADPNHSSLFPAAGYSPRAKKFLFAWAEKTSGDTVKLRLRDEQLADAPGPLDMAETGFGPKIAGGDDDFVVAWFNNTQAGGPPGAARVTSDGRYIIRGVTNTGGKAAQFTWDLVVRFGQPALIWAEQGGSGPDLWIDPLCE